MPQMRPRVAGQDGKARAMLSSLQIVFMGQGKEGGEMKALNKITRKELLRKFDEMMKDRYDAKEAAKKEKEGRGK